ncbi:hypothetical protein [Flavobacterium sp.]|uniref:hypothetical protein n=1 Tax=Flavobacterium sp. TaxID=239 RepID=UPI0038FC6D21
MKTRNKFLLFCFCLPFISNAQLDANVAKEFPAHIVFKINQVNKKIDLSVERQKALGNYLLQNEKIANESLAKGESLEKLKQLNNLSKENLKNILTPTELDNYLAANDKTNKLLWAIKYKNQLNLNNVQLEKLHRENDYLDSISKTPNFDKETQGKNKISTILSPKQYLAFLAIFHHKNAKKKTEKQWENLKNLKIVSVKDSAKIVPTIYKYYIDKNSLEDFESDNLGYLGKNSLKDNALENFDKMKKSFARKKLELTKPAILIRADMLTNTDFSKDQFSIAIKYEKELSLTAIQIDSLLAKYKEMGLSKLNFETKYSSKKFKESPFEYKNLSKILTPKQMDLYLIKKNQNLAKENSKDNWDKLATAGLTKGLDEATTIQELTNYELKSLVADEKIKISRNQRTLFERRDIQVRKPELLKQLDSIKRNEDTIKSTKNALKW